MRNLLKIKMYLWIYINEAQHVVKKTNHKNCPINFFNE